jgi:hypothetical protein
MVVHNKSSSVNGANRYGSVVARHPSCTQHYETAKLHCHQENKDSFINNKPVAAAAAANITAVQSAITTGLSALTSTLQTATHNSQ